MNYRPLGVAVCTAFLACASQPPVARVAAAPPPDRARLALAAGNHSGAIAELLLIAGRCPVTAAERDALLTAAALALDPSNASRQLDLGASLAARYLATAPRGDGTGRPLARAFYLIAIELGAEPVTAPGCVSTDSAAVVLPHTGSASMPDRIRVLERELARLREEMVRIRKTLEP